MNVSVVHARRGSWAQCPCGWGDGTAHPFASAAIEPRARAHAHECGRGVEVTVRP